MRLDRVFVTSVLLLVLYPFSSLASSSRTIDADALSSSDKARTYTLPSAAGGTVMLSAGLAQEAPSGTINGSNTAFTLSSTPGTSSSVLCALNGLILTQGGGNDYTISGASITMSTAPATNQVLWCYYSKY